MVQLNNLIFKDISIYLVYKCKFNDVLELSLLSKSSFKIFQDIINFKCKIADIVLPINSFYKYINNGDTTSIYKLIKLDEIEYIKSKKVPIGDIQLDDNNNNLKQYLQSKCCNLKHVQWDKNEMQLINFDKDLSLNGFFGYDSLSLMWCIKYKPISNAIEDEELGLHSHYESFGSFEYSFQFLDQFNNEYGKVKKLKLSTIIGSASLNIQKLDGILNYCKSIESLKFTVQRCTISFLNKLLATNQNNTLKSLSIGFDGNVDNDSAIYDSLSTRNNLKRLILKCKNSQSSKIIESILNGNKDKTMVALGILFDKVYTSSDLNQILKPLYKLPLLSIVYCNSVDLELYLDFIKNHPRRSIKSLKIIFKFQPTLILENSINKLISHINETKPTTSLISITIYDYLSILAPNKSRIIQEFEKHPKIKLIFKNDRVY